MKQIKAWAMFDGKGEILIWSVRFNEAGYLSELTPNERRAYEKGGYQVKPITITWRET